MSEDLPIYYAPRAPEAEAILSSPHHSFWLKDALRSALARDPVDAANDAELLLSVLSAHCEAVQKAARLVVDGSPRVDGA